MTAWVDAIVSPLKSASDITKGLLEVRDRVKLGDTVVKLQAQIMTAQQGASAAQARETAMTEEIRELKARMAELEAWATEKQRYQLTDFGGGTFAYDLKPAMENGEPSHRICAHCYQQGHKSILQFQRTTNYQQNRYVCRSCDSEFDFGVRRNPPRQVRAITSHNPLA